MMIEAVQAREAVHLLILQKLVHSAGPESFIVKGGVNLRLFFGSARYSEDMDLDGESSSRQVLRSVLSEVFVDRDLRARIRRLGLRGLDPGEGPNKDTETTFRYKFGVLASGGIRYPTKVEISFRERAAGDEFVVEAIRPDVAELYPGEVERDLEIPHYSRSAATRQKLVALVERGMVQARDVFDLHVLHMSEPENGSLPYLRESVSADVLKDARDRVFEVSYEEYRGQVLEFLDKEARAEFGDREAWDRIRLGVAGFIEEIQGIQGDVGR